MEDDRRKRVSSSGRVDSLCTLCEEEGKPRVRADFVFVVASTMNGNERRITVCSEHANQLNHGKLPYDVVRWKKGADWADPI